MNLLLFYLPSLLGILALTLHFYRLLATAQKAKSMSTPIFLSLLVVGVGLLVSWIIVLSMAILFIGDGVSLLSWQVLLLPMLWGIILIPVNILIRR